MAKPKVLIVEDDEGVRVDISKTLARAGFSVSSAVDCVSGWEEAEKSVFDLILLDLTMPDFDGQMSKNAGIDLLKRLKTSDTKSNAETPVLVLTATATLENTKEALNLGALNFYEKSEFSKSRKQIIADLKEKINKKTERNKVDRNFELQVNCTDELKFQDDDKEIFQKLYSDCRQIDLSPLLAGYSTAKVYLTNSINLKGERLMPFVTKIGKKSQIDNEYENFKNYVEYKISSGCYPEVLKVSSSDSNKLAGLKISFIGADWKGMSDLRAYFRTHSTPEIKEVVENLFERTFKYWHENKGKKRPVPLLKEYSYFSDFSRLRAAMNRFFKEYKGQSIIKYDGAENAFYDPVTSLKFFDEAFRNTIVNTYICTIHGDLNVKNVLVDGNKMCWLIDFQYTGKEHILKDFVELETSIKYGCVNAGFEEFWQLDQCLMSQEDFRSPPEFHHSNPELQKAFDTVLKIREYAYLAVAPSRDMTEYYIGLIYYTLNLIRFPDEVITKEKKKCILLTVSLLFDKLKKTEINIGFVGKEDALSMKMRKKADEEKYRVLIIDDEDNYLTNLYKVLDRTGNYSITKAGNSIEAKRILEENEEEMFDLCISDLRMPDFDGAMSDKAGLDILKYIKEKYPYRPVIILSASTDFKVARDSISLYGASTFCNKEEIVTNKNKFLNEIESFIKESYEKWQDDLDIRTAIDNIRQMLPQDVPELETGDISFFFEPSKHIGGDFYDFIPLNSDDLVILIGDVSGKGLSAAVLLSKFCPFYRDSLKRTDLSMSHLMNKWNVFVLENKTKFYFITMFFAILNQKEKTLRLCNAGHNPPLIVSKNGDVTETTKGKTPLGALKKQEYDEKEISLNSGDVVVLYTDGFSDGASVKKEEFGVKKLAETVRENRHGSATEIKDSVIASFKRFIDPDCELDDRTLIILKID